MSVQRTSQLLETIDSGIVKAVLTELSVYPYVSTEKLKSIAIDNADTTNTLTFTLTYLNSETITNYVKPSTTYEGNYNYFDTIDVVGSNDFVIELRGEK